MSRGCNLLSVDPVSTAESDIDPAVDWAIAQGATILNMSFKLNDSVDGALDWSDIYFDYMVHNARVFFTKSAGNEGTGTGMVTSPGRGFNSLTVGNVQDQSTLGWADDAMRATSSFVDPATGGEKPEVAAYGSQLISTTTVAPWTGDQGSGTSFAAPLVAAIAGLCVDRTPGYADDPWMLKAMILASALAHNIEGAARLSEYDGAGKAVATATKVGTWGMTLTEASFDANDEYELPIVVPLYGEETNRITLAYTFQVSSETGTPDVASYDRSDLDLRLYVGGTRVASSTYGTHHAFEIIDYMPITNGNAKVRILNYDWHPDVASIRMGVAYVAKSALGSGPDPSEDNYEQNDTRATAAYPSGSNWEQTWLSDIDCLGVQADDDWYRIEVTPGYNLVQVDCRFFDADGDIDIQLVDTNGVVLGTSNGTADNEWLSVLTPAEGGTCYIRVYFDDQTNTYDLWWDDILPGLPAAPGGVSAQPGTAPGIAELSWNPVAGVYGYHIYYDEDDTNNPPFVPWNDGTPANGSFVGNVTSIVISNLAAGTTYYFAVVATNLSGASPYSTNVSSRTGAYEDNYEQNDTRGTAYYPGYNWENTWLSSISNRGVQYDGDYYRIYVMPGYERIIVTCSFTHAEGDVDLYLYNGSGMQLAASTGSGNGEAIDYTVGVGGTNYYILVSGDSSGNLYDLKWDDAIRIVPLPPAAVAASPGPGAGQMRVSWTASAGATGYKIFYDEDSGNPPFSPTVGGSPASGANVGNVTSATVSALSTGAYYYVSARAYDTDGDSDYAIQVRTRTGASEDAYEENDSWLSPAYPGGVNWENTYLTEIDGAGAQYDSDWYLIEVTSGYEHLIARCTFVNAEGNLGLSLYSTNGSLVASSLTTNDIEQIDRILPAPGGYLLRVDGNNGGNVYDLWWDDLVRLLAPSYVNAQTGASGGEVRLSWAMVSNALSYIIYYDEDDIGSYLPSDDGIPPSGSNVGNVTNVTVRGLDGGQIYFFTVAAVDALGTSPLAYDDSVTTPEYVPVLVGIEYDPASGQIRLRWFSDTGEQYDVERARGFPSSFVPVSVGIPATPSTNTYQEASSSTATFYRIRRQ